MRLGLSHKGKLGRLPGGAIKIGSVARHFGVSVDLLRLYEREGLVLTLKSGRGTRYYTENDYLWIGTVLRLVREARITFAGIRHLLALIPCYAIRGCGFESKLECPYIAEPAKPCWANRMNCPVISDRDCYFCPVYRSAPNSENIRALLVKDTGTANEQHKAAD